MGCGRGSFTVRISRANPATISRIPYTRPLAASSMTFLAERSPPVAAATASRSRLPQRAWTASAAPGVRSTGRVSRSASVIAPIAATPPSTTAPSPGGTPSK